MFDQEWVWRSSYSTFFDKEEREAKKCLPKDDTNSCYINLDS